MSMGDYVWYPSIENLTGKQTNYGIFLQCNFFMKRMNSSCPQKHKWIFNTYVDWKVRQKIRLKGFVFYKVKEQAK